MPVYQYLSHALRIMRDEPNWRCWGPLVAKLPDPEQTEVRTFLRIEARKRQLHERSVDRMRHA